MRTKSFAVTALGFVALAWSGTVASAATSTSAKPTASGSSAHPTSKPASSPAKAPAKAAASPTASAAKGHPPAKGPNAAPNARTARPVESSARRQHAGGPSFDEAALGADTPELRALAAAERELFPPSQREAGQPWPDELPFPVASAEDKPRVHSSGLSPTPVPGAPPALSESGKDLAWLSRLEMPDLPIRWDPRVVRYLEFFKNDPRGRATFSVWYRRSGRYIATIRKTLRQKSLPEDLASLAMIESGFEPVARSPVGAVGLWQFMPETGRIYGLSQDRWTDLRMNVSASTEAAADFLADLYRRFGSWELAMAAYNMGYGGVLTAIRRYNTNDYWALSKLEGSLPWETTLYVPKILAASVVSRNLAAFGFQDLTLEPALEGEEVTVSPGVALAAVAQACGTTTKEIEALNPELRASRTPPAKDGTAEDWPVKVPIGKASSCGVNLARVRKAEPPTERYVLRFGESLEQVAQARKTSVAKLVELNGIAQGEVVRGGTVLLVPKVDASAATVTTPTEPKKTASLPAVVVPSEVFVYPDRKRVFYRVQLGDTVKDVCSTFKVTADELRRWNDIEPTARLLENMTLQLFLPVSTDLSHVVVLSESEVRTIVAGTDEFFRHWDDKGRHRTVVTAKGGETLESVGRKFNVSPGLMERINRRARSEILAEGERVVVWTTTSTTPSSTEAPPTLATTLPAPEPTTPLTTPPEPERLPPLQ